MKKLIGKFAIGSVFLASLALTACGTTPAAPPTSPAPKTNATIALEKVASSKGFTGEVDAQTFSDEGKTYKISTVNRTAADGSTEAVMAIENPDGKIELSALSIPAVSEVNANTVDQSTVIDSLDESGNVIKSQKLSDLNGEVQSNAIPWYIYIMAKAGIYWVKTTYGPNAIYNGCDWVFNKVQSKVGWRIPGWFKYPTCSVANSIWNVL